MLYIVTPPGIQYEGETREEAFERDLRNAEHNAAVRREHEKWRPGRPAEFYRKWCEKHAPHLLEPRLS